MQRREPTKEELIAQSKARQIDCLFEKCTRKDVKRIERRHKRFKSQAKNLASQKEADKNADFYEWQLLRARMDEIENKFNVSCETREGL